MWFQKNLYLYWYDFITLLYQYWCNTVAVICSILQLLTCSLIRFVYCLKLGRYRSVLYRQTITYLSELMCESKQVHSTLFICRQSENQNKASVVYQVVLCYYALCSNLNEKNHVFFFFFLPKECWFWLNDVAKSKMFLKCHAMIFQSQCRRDYDCIHGI